MIPFSNAAIRAMLARPFLVACVGAGPSPVAQALADHPGVRACSLGQGVGQVWNFWKMRWHSGCECMVMDGWGAGFWYRPLLPEPDALIVLDQQKLDLPAIPRLDATAIPADQVMDEVWDFLLRLPGFFVRFQPRAEQRARFGAVWLCSAARHYKFCFTSQARRELACAVGVMRRAAAGYLHDAVPTILHATDHLLITSRYAPLVWERHLSAVVAYFESNRAHAVGQSVTLWRMVNSALLQETFGRDPDYLTCRNRLERVAAQPGFAHRDFHADNILWDETNQRMVLIDWGDAREDAHFLFDVLNLVFFRLATCLQISHIEAIGRWLHSGGDLLPAADPLATIWARYAPEITPSILSAYILDYITVDLNKMTAQQISRKRQKYQRYLAMAVQAG